MPSKDEVGKTESKAMDQVVKKPKAASKPAAPAKPAKTDKPAVADKPVAADKPVKVKDSVDVKAEAVVLPEVKPADDAVATPSETKPEESEPKPSEPVVKTVKSDDSDASAPVLPPVKARELRGTIIKVVAGVVAFVAIVVVVFGVLVYGYASDNPAVKAVAAVVPYPVEMVNGHVVTYSDYLFEVDANKRAFQNNAKLNNQPAVDYNSADGKKQVAQIKQHVLDQLARDSVTAQLASQKKVVVSDKEINDSLDVLYKSNGGQDTVLKTIKTIYGWSLGDLKHVLYKGLLAKDLQAKVTSDPAADAVAKTKAQSVLSDIKGGADFTETAKKQSQSSDAASGGDLGFFTKGQLPAALQAAAEALQPGQVSDPIKDTSGYEILKVVEKKDDGSIHAQHILIETVDYTSYFNDQFKKATVNKYIKV